MAFLKVVVPNNLQHKDNELRKHFLSVSNSKKYTHNTTYTGDGAGDQILTTPSASVLATVDPQLLNLHCVIFAL